MSDAAPFTVSPDSLTTLAGKFSGLVGELDNAAASVRAGDAAAAGDPSLEGAISSYLNCWSSGLGDLCQLLDQVRQALTSAATGYAGTDGAANNALV